MFQPNMFDSHHHLLEMTHKTPENEMDMIRDDEFESKSGTDIMEAASGDDQDPNQRPKKKRYHRHTQHQIQEMESFFKECPHPDDKQRKELGRRLGLEPLQVKFWFQNKRTQMKAQHERHENTQLRTENEKLRAENIRYKEALSNATCPNCGGPAAIGEMSFDEQHLRIENARLREEIDRISGIAAKYVGKPMLSYPHLPPGASRSLDLGVGNYGAQSGMIGEIYGAGDLLRSVSGPTEADKPMVIELAVAAMEELVRMAQAGEPLWVPSGDNSTETLSEDEYVRAFPRGIGPKPLGLKSEASRESAVVIMNHINLVEILMDVNQWSNVFSSIVSRALTLEVLSTGVAGNYNGALQVMTAEFQVPTPLVPTRENYFVRYCKQHADGTWAVVDVSLDNLRPTSVSRCRRRPSGCLIQELPNGYSKVMWVEHVEIDDRAVHSIYRALVNSGLAFGAKRWVATLDRQCERLASAMANNIPAGDVGVITTPEGRKSMLKLAERMVMSFCAGVGASTAHTWTTLSGSGADDVRVMTRKSMDDPGRPPGIVLSAATSFWLPVLPKRVFDFLRDENSRSEWDILSNGGLVQEMAHIANGRDPGNSVSLLRVNSANSSQSNMLILQESSTDSTGSYVIYAPVDIVAMNVVLSGGDPDYVALLPSGFAILPDGPMNQGGGAGISEVGSGGTLLTVAFQILVDSVPTAKLSLGSVATVNSLIKCTVERIKAALSCDKA
ncbi:homeobox-leucine zipper protein MERISTEM L1-like [Coffea eugenioides]|uniref:Homeobox-leucine zipper protein PROTODERMAL FACTOR 2-like n=1 Tax=Coffea arabica TaxID=13443 RepID=A0A6P6VQV8_COFAR|nr:homeobox-leucine zipper protein MERISTEM L1-like [Coffea arabica]XP_027105032.1 homeobox-leucine zipper protein MERISTEM L1-like [Coffea arabica]XP_027111570.1 homeobox-leucine zipper protein MERISTEM L1-like [Coffea arabica]XP_027111571.1 homeobox-leucine zipper protein MERISTEM L1-like [Coffea arabica]XP_027159776.1 homeobox-leucine zipper protein MERISTEM L1-like [Coffea eugenioides]XP_027159777.1 homeobox-leucine zipper protein MERISTEM L1-like [Coffea eugenioides]